MTAVMQTETVFFIERSPSFIHIVSGPGARFCLVIWNTKERGAKLQGLRNFSRKNARARADPVHRHFAAYSSGWVAASFW